MGLFDHDDDQGLNAYDSLCLMTLHCYRWNIYKDEIVHAIGCPHFGDKDSPITDECMKA